MVQTFRVAKDGAAPRVHIAVAGPQVFATRGRDGVR